MKIPVELTTNVRHAIGKDMAKACALGWFEAAFDKVPDIPTETLECLYEYAFVDGMEYLHDLLLNNDKLKDDESRSKTNNSLVSCS